MTQHSKHTATVVSESSILSHKLGFALFAYASVHAYLEPDHYTASSTACMPVD